MYKTLYYNTRHSALTSEWTYVTAQMNYLCVDPLAVICFSGRRLERVFKRNELNKTTFCYFIVFNAHLLNIIMDEERQLLSDCNNKTSLLLPQQTNHHRNHFILQVHVHISITSHRETLQGRNTIIVTLSKLAPYIYVPQL